MEPSWEWHVGDPIGLGNDVGAPEVPYMSYGPKSRESSQETQKSEEEEKRQRKIERLRHRANMLSDEAWKLYDEGRYDEALIFIDRALECCGNEANTWNRKAIILHVMGEYEDALKNYDEAMGISSSEVFKHNKATCLIDYACFLRDRQNIESALAKINDSLEIFENIDDNRREDEAFYIKAVCLEKLNNIPEAFNCYKKALEHVDDDNNMKWTYRQNRDRLLRLMDDKDIICPGCGNHLKLTDNFCVKCGWHVDESINPSLKDSGGSKKQIIPGEDNLGGIVMPIDEKLKSIGRENLITIAGSYYYDLDTRLVDGAGLRIVREPDNIHDSDAIAVYSGNDKVGYVSNSNITNSPFSSKASELDWIGDVAYCKYLLNYGGYHIAMIDRKE